MPNRCQLLTFTDNVMKKTQEPDFFSKQVTDAKRFFIEGASDRSTKIKVVCGGCEQTHPDFKIDRESFPYFSLEFVAKGKGTAEPIRKTGDPAIKITKVKSIVTCPHGIELIMVKVETDQPGLYGVGCATFRQRSHAVVAAIDEYLDDFCRGKDVDNIEDLWQTTYVSSYWRNGPVLNNALSGLDQALWDIKGKRAGMPVYQLLGGKCRFAVDCYSHANGKSPEEVADDAQRIIEEGFRPWPLILRGHKAL